MNEKIEMEKQYESAKAALEEMKNVIEIAEKRFRDYLETKDDPKWESIAKSGREHVLKNLTNDNAIDSLIELIQKIS